jgi:outer membrane protein assembly factor BamB
LAFCDWRQIYSSPALGADGAIYFGSLDGHVYALNSDGSLRWKVFLREWVISSPAIGADGTMYVGSYNRALYALSAAGQIAWKYETNKYVFSSPTIAPDGTLYVGSDDGNVYALKTASMGLAQSAWAKFRGDARNSGRAPAPAARSGE